MGVYKQGRVEPPDATSQKPSLTSDGGTVSLKPVSSPVLMTWPRYNMTVLPHGIFLRAYTPCDIRPRFPSLLRT